MITNHANISLALAVWLVQDNYDHITEDNYISATSMMAPLRHIVLRGRPNLSGEPTTDPDVTEFIARALGNSLHTSVEAAWKEGHARALKLLGYPDGVIENIAINPTDEYVKANPNTIPVYLEQRVFRELGDYKIGGKFDLVTDGVLQDTKSTSTYVWTKGSVARDEQYQLQGSIYRWLDAGRAMPRITADYIRINFIFTDWSKAEAKYNPKYPQQRIEHKDVSLLSLADTERWIREKLLLVNRFKSANEKLIPECTDEELWRSEPVYKYYSDPGKTTGRSTKNFDNISDANVFMAERGNKGVVISIQGEPKRCNYCSVFNSCTQKDKYFSA